MTTHYFICDICKVVIEDTDTKIVHECPKCGTDMRWDMNVGGGQGDYHFVSESLAINPDQIAEHKATFPDVGVLPDGRIEFNSFRQHDKYLKKAGLVKHPKKIKPDKSNR